MVNVKFENNYALITMERESVNAIDKEFVERFHSVLNQIDEKIRSNQNDNRISK